MTICKITDQLIHCDVKEILSKRRFFITFLYARNDSTQRREGGKWRRSISPWMLPGLSLEILTIAFMKERDLEGLTSILGKFCLFKENSINECQLQEMICHGSFFTWSNIKASKRETKAKTIALIGQSSLVPAFYQEQEKENDLSPYLSIS